MWCINIFLSVSYSALYVVDLKKFRETAAGDNLRVFYESLSKDPNSLSNLDQASKLTSFSALYIFIIIIFFLEMETKFSLN